MLLKQTFLPDGYTLGELPVQKQSRRFACVEKTTQSLAVYRQL